MNATRYYVPVGGNVPRDLLEVAGRAGDDVCFFPAGGGFQRRMPARLFEEAHREVAAEELAAVEPYAATFDIDGMFGDIPGYTLGGRWNGWARPLFPREACEQLLERFPGAYHDPETDAYVFPREDAGPEDAEAETYLPETLIVRGAPLKVWPVGSGSWTWSETGRG